jgi:hypothetical protein
MEEAGHACEVGGKKDSAFELKMRYKGVVKVAQTIAVYTRKKSKLFLGHVVEAQRLPETRQLHLQNWQNGLFIAWADSKTLRCLKKFLHFQAQFI